ncbi:lipid transporter ATP-binding/permease protein [compost metagenome]
MVKADKIVVMQEGRIVEEGSHDSLARRKDGLYARLNQLQVTSTESMAVGGDSSE